MERGGVAMIVAVFLAGGVLLGAGALAVDVGNMMFERRQQQNGADAAAFLLAQKCEANPAACADTSAVRTTLDAISDQNANDRASQLSPKTDATNGICGSRLPSGAVLPGCASNSSDANLGEYTKCPPLPDWLKADTGVPYVETYTVAETGGATGLRAFFNGGSTNVGACSRVAWGNPGGATVLPLTFSYCEYEDAIANAGYGNNPVVPANKYKGETALALKYATGGHPGDPCPDLGHTGMDAPGGFGWLDQTDCKTQVDNNGWVNVDTGKSGPSYCLKAGEVIYIPIFDCVSKAKSLCDNVAGGANTWYHINGFAAFYVTAWEFPGDKVSLAGYPGTSANNECKKEATDKKSCIFGWFLDDYQDFTPGGVTSGGTNYGSTKFVAAG